MRLWHGALLTVAALPLLSSGAEAATPAPTPSPKVTSGLLPPVCATPQSAVDCSTGAVLTTGPRQQTISLPRTGGGAGSPDGAPAAEAWLLAPLAAAGLLAGRRRRTR